MAYSTKQLIKTQCLINGEWQSAKSGAKTKVSNPATGETIASVPDMGQEETAHTIEFAKAAQSSWSKITPEKRGRTLRRWFELILEHKTQLAEIMTMEQGKPLDEAKGEIMYAASFVEWFSEEAKRSYGDTLPPANEHLRYITLKQPVGVVGAITPWNFPAAMITRKLAPAIAAGCSVVIKPAEDTPLSALALGQLAVDAGVPNGVVNIICGDAATIGEEFTSNPDVKKISFTGSTRVGSILMEQSAPTIKNLSLELGGNAPFIVLKDADLDKAVDTLMAAKFRNMGQACIAANRVIVDIDVAETFTQKLKEAMQSLRVGNGMDEGVKQGPLINEAAVEKVEGLIADAVLKGAQLVYGGRRHALGQTFFEPTILTSANSSMRISEEEIFGPIVAIYPVDNEDEALKLANDTPFGLAAYVCGRHMGKLMHFAEQLESGMVGVNTATLSNAQSPFGGIKQSGLGREGAKEGLDAFMELKTLAIDISE